MMACMILKECKNIQPFYAEPKTYAAFEGKQQSFGLKDTIPLPTYEIQIPKQKLLDALKIVHEHKNQKLTKKEMAVIAEEKELIIINAEKLNHSQARFASLDKNIISGIIYFILILVCILITSSLTKPLKSILSLATFGFSSLIDRIGGIIIGVSFAFVIITISIISLSRITYHFEVTNSNIITNYAIDTPFIKNKINNIEKQFINSHISSNSMKIINSLNETKISYSFVKNCFSLLATFSFIYYCRNLFCCV